MMWGGSRSTGPPTGAPSEAESGVQDGAQWGDGGKMAKGALETWAGTAGVVVALFRFNGEMVPTASSLFGGWLLCLFHGSGTRLRCLS